MENSTPHPTQKIYYVGAVASLITLIFLCILWEMWLAPLRPNGSWMVLKVIPLLVPLRGVIKRDVYTLQWSSMLILLYFTEGIVRGFSDKNVFSAALGWIEVGLVIIYFLCSILYLRPFKKIAKQLAQQAIHKASK